MHPFKLSKLKSVNTAVDCINRQFKHFSQATELNNLKIAMSKTISYKLDNIRKIDVCIAYDNVQGYQFEITSFYSMYGHSVRTYNYRPIHADISQLMGMACDMNEINSDARYSQQERQFGA